MLRTAVRALLRLYPRRWASRVPIVFTDLVAPRDTCVEQLSAAIALIEKYDPRWGRWMLKHVRHIIVWPGHYTSADRLGGFQVSSAFLSEASRPLLASVLVHETVHVRIAKHGIPFEAQHRERIERICVRQQADFLRRISPEGAELAGYFEAALSLEWWTDEAHRKDIDRLVEEASLPSWMASVLARGD